MSKSYDAIVIGAGQAGPSLAVRLAAAGHRTALIEREHLGGTCVNDGCIPTKTLIASARAAFVARHAADFGVRLEGTVSVDMKAVKERKDRVVGESIRNLTQWLLGTPNLSLVWGHARFVAAHAVEVAGEVLEAPKIFINVGGRALLPDWPGLDRASVLNNTSMMQLETLPEHLLVIGGSYIGLEFAQMYRRFGAQVTVLEVADRLIAQEDPDISREVQAILEAEGVKFHLSVRDARVAARGAGAPLRVSFDCSHARQGVEVSHVLAAIGRRPNTDDLGLAQAGIAANARGFIQVDDGLNTNVPGIWALGDVNGRGAFTHTSYNDHEIVAGNLLDGANRRVSDRIPAYALFTDPPLARIGMNEAQARASGRPVLRATLPMARVGRARERGETAGFMKVLVDAGNQRILGAALLGIEADEVVHMLLTAMAAGISYKQVQQTVYMHPTVGELIPTLLSKLEPLADAGPPEGDDAPRPTNAPLGSLAQERS
ncbi:MAG: FAD-containing oxidoreductase [Burkholderiales bacterium]|nr:FAD-containing oxidoreductase [Burkholderiales bacterium]